MPEDVLEAWQAHMPGPPPALKPNQCLVLTDSKALFAQNGHLWLHNLYFASLLALPTRQALLLSTGYVGALRREPHEQLFQVPGGKQPGWEACAGTTDLRLYLTDVGVHVSPSGGSRAVALVPLTSASSVSLFAKGAARCACSHAYACASAWVINHIYDCTGTSRRR